MKYDANSLELDANFGGGQSATGLTTIADNADISSATAGKFSFELPSSLLTNFALNEVFNTVGRCICKRCCRS